MTDRITGVDIPDDAVVVGEIALVSYLDEEGTERWSLALLQSQVIGLLAMAQYATLAA